MDDFWQLSKLGLKLDNPEDRAEYDCLLRRYRQEEEKDNRDKLLFDGQAFGPPAERPR
jgi:hypothetical protein